jgi:hypothetical protein
VVGVVVTAVVTLSNVVNAIAFVVVAMLVLVVSLVVADIVVAVFLVVAAPVVKFSFRILLGCCFLFVIAY